MNIRLKLERVIGAVERAFDVVRNRVEPTHAARFGGGTATGAFDDRGCMHCRDDGAERPQSIAIDLRVGMQRLLRPGGQRLQGEARHRRDHGLPRMPLVRNPHGDDERDFVLRATPGFATVALPVQIRIVDQHDAAQLAPRLAPGHCLHHVVLESPGGARAHAQVTHQLQCSHVGLALSQQIERQEPARQWQLGADEQRVGDQAAMVPAGRTLPEPFTVAVGTAAVPASRADKPFRPACSAQRAGARRFAAILVEEAGQ